MYISLPLFKPHKETLQTRSQDVSTLFHAVAEGEAAGLDPEAKYRLSGFRDLGFRGLGFRI